MSTFLGKRQLLFEVTMSPVVEKHLSKLNVDEIAKYFLAIVTISGYLFSHVLHHFKGFKSNRS